MGIFERMSLFFYIRAFHYGMLFKFYFKEVQIMDNITASGAEKTKKEGIIFTSTWKILLLNVKRNRLQSVTDTLCHAMQCITKYIWRTG